MTYSVVRLRTVAFAAVLCAVFLAAWTAVASAADTTRPSNPTNLVVTPRAESATLTWTGSTDAESGIASYGVEYQPCPGGTCNGVWTTIATVEGPNPATTAVVSVAAGNGKVRVYAKNGDGLYSLNATNSVTNNIAADTQNPTTPGALNSVGHVDSSNTVAWENLAWTASTDDGYIRYYEVEFKRTSETDWICCVEDDGHGNTVGATTTATTTAQVGDLQPGTSYDFRVWAVDTKSNTSTKTATFTVTTPTSVDSTPPAKVTAVTAASVTSPSPGIKVDWAQTTDTGGSGLANYFVERATNASGPWTQLTPNGLPTSTLTFTDTTGTAGTGYVYRVYSKDGNNNYGASSDPTASVTFPSASCTGDVTAPPQVTGLTATGTSSATLNWNAVTDNGCAGLANYFVERKTGAGAYATIGTLNASTTTYTDNSGVAGTTYSYRVYTKDNANNYGASSTVVNFTFQSAVSDTTPPTTPSSLAVSGTPTQTGVNLTWTASTDTQSPPVSYEIYKSANGGTSYALAGTSTTNSFNVTGLTANTTYSFRVRAKDSASPANFTGYSNVVTATTAAAGSGNPTRTVAFVGDTCPDSGSLTTCKKVADKIKQWGITRFLHGGDFQYQNDGTNGSNFLASDSYSTAFGGTNSLHPLTIPTFGQTHDTETGSGRPSSWIVNWFNTNGAPEINGEVTKFLSQGWYHVTIPGTAWNVVDVDYTVPTSGTVNQTTVKSAVASYLASLPAHSCVIGLQHAPVWGSPSSGHPNGTEAAWLQTTYANGGVDLSLSGHQHFYERGVSSGVPWITNGLGGEGTNGYSRTSPIASGAQHFESAVDHPYAPTKLLLSDTGWSAELIDAVSNASLDSTSGTCG